MRKRKYNAKKTNVDNIRFDSNKEGRRYSTLKLMQSTGLISLLEMQVRFKIEIGGVKVCYDTGRQMVYVADFCYEEGGKAIIEDTKGVRTQVYKMKKALMRAMGYEILET